MSTDAYAQFYYITYKCSGQTVGSCNFVRKKKENRNGVDIKVHTICVVVCIIIYTYITKQSGIIHVAGGIFGNRRCWCTGQRNLIRATKLFISYYYYYFAQRTTKTLVSERTNTVPTYVKVHYFVYSERIFMDRFDSSMRLWIITILLKHKCSPRYTGPAIVIIIIILW